MNLKIINSNSAGNCYILENDSEALIIECGVGFKEIKKALNFNITKVAGCIVSHLHQDHCRSIKDVLNAGILVYSSQGTHDALGTTKHHRSEIISNGKTFKVGGFLIKPFDIKHDVPEPFGFLIHHRETGLVLFMTDTYYCEYTFPGLNNIIIEANYCPDILEHCVEAGITSRFQRERIIASHMSFETTKGTLLAYDLSRVNNIVLIHLSNDHSDAEKFRNEVGNLTGKTVHIASPGVCIPFNKTPF